MTYEAMFEIDQRVDIVPLQRVGVVLSIWFTRRNTEYEVRYFDNAEVKTTYFFENELQAKTQEDTNGNRSE